MSPSRQADRTVGEPAAGGDERVPGGPELLDLREAGSAGEVHRPEAGTRAGAATAVGHGDRTVVPDPQGPGAGTVRRWRGCDWT